MIGNPIEYRRGDLFKEYNPSRKTVLCHGANAQGVMNSGVAKTFHNMYPKAFNQYVTDIRDGYSLGSVSYFSVSDNLLLASAITQEYYGRRDYRYVSYDAVNQAFRKIYEDAIKYKYQQVIFPKIGAGLGGGDWNVIEACIISAHHESLVDPDKIQSICFVQ